MMTVKKIRTGFLLKFIPGLILLVYGFASCCDASPRSMRAPEAKPISTVRIEKAETPTRRVFLSAITFFQKNLSPLDGPRCVFYPTCSHYAHLAIEHYGVLKGIAMSGDRLIRCNPSAMSGHDHPLLPSGRLYDPPARNAFLYE
jgi:putative membrane protein insertion efficiency factor